MDVDSFITVSVMNPDSGFSAKKGMLQINALERKKHFHV